MRITTVAALIALLALPAVARADRRYYAWTYNAATAEPGGLDVELWGTLNQGPKKSDPNRWDYQLELETGITSMWDVALYGVMTYESGITAFQAVKLETRYRLSHPGEWFVDPVLYFEVKKEFTGDKPWAIEEKVIVAKDIGAVNISLNVSAEQEWPSGGGTGLEWGYNLGASYEIVPALRLGGETYGAWQRGPGEPYVFTTYAGPAASVAYWRMWLVAGVGWGLNESSDRFRARAVLAIQF